MVAKKIRVTGGAGFIGSHFIKHMLKKYKDYQLINLDLLSYAGNLNNLVEIEDNPDYHFIHGDISDRKLVNKIFSRGLDYVVHFAAETHVDRSINNPEIFIKTNLIGTEVLLEACRKYNIKSFVQISTDEVYGSLSKKGFFTEDSTIAPNNPYSASKAGADMLVRAYFKTYCLPLIITRSSNNYGSNQYPENLIPMVISNAIKDREISVYGDGLQARDWIYVKDHCRALDVALHKGKHGEIYNICANNEKKNIDLIKFILAYLGKSEKLIKYVKDRPGHDRRYALNTEKIQKELGWAPEYDFEDSLKETIDWYVNNLF